MTAITKNFNSTAIAANQNLIPYALPSVAWFNGLVIIWLWLAASDDAELRRVRFAKNRKQAQIEQQAKPVPQRVSAPAFR